jgi:hypothetical protein
MLATNKLLVSISKPRRARTNQGTALSWLSERVGARVLLRNSRPNPCQWKQTLSRTGELRPIADSWPSDRPSSNRFGFPHDAASLTSLTSSLGEFGPSLTVFGLSCLSLCQYFGPK